MYYIDHKFENPKCWSYVFVRVAQAQDSRGSGCMPPQKVFWKLGSLLKWLFGAFWDEFLAYQLQLNDKLEGLFFGWNTLFTLENILFTICVVIQHVLWAIYLLFVGITAWKSRLF